MQENQKRKLNWNLKKTHTFIFSFSRAVYRLMFKPWVRVELLLQKRKSDCNQQIANPNCDIPFKKKTVKSNQNG